MQKNTTIYSIKISKKLNFQKKSCKFLMCELPGCKAKVKYFCIIYL